MAGFHLNIPTANLGLFNKASDKIRNAFSQALQVAVAELAFTIKSRGDEDILSAGKFTQRWTSSFTVLSTPKATVTSDRYVLEVFFTIPYAHIHEFGGVVKPKGNLGSLFGPPLLWIPLSFANVPKSAGTGPNAGTMTAQEYGLSVAPLFRVNRKSGAPLLFDSISKKPKYFGLAQAIIPKRFHIRDICAKSVADFRTTFTSAIVKTR